MLCHKLWIKPQQQYKNNKCTSDVMKRTSKKKSKANIYLKETILTFVCFGAPDLLLHHQSTVCYCWRVIFIEARLAQWIVKLNVDAPVLLLHQYRTLALFLPPVSCYMVSQIPLNPFHTAQHFIICHVNTISFCFTCYLS